MKRLVIIDGNAILHRAFHALPPLTKEDGTQVNAVYGFAAMLMRLAKDLSPSHMAVAFDRPKPTFRKELFKEYQATRPKMDDALVSQVGPVHELVTAFGIPVFEMDGYEADDVIGTVAKHAIQNRTVDQVIIVTGDRDILQLVKEGAVYVWMPVKGLSEAKLFGEKETLARMGVGPSLIPDLKALAGDQSDNYPGVQGIGPKTAISLLETYGSLKGIYEALARGSVESMSGKIADRLKAEKEQALLFYDLAVIRDEVPLKVELSHFEGVHKEEAKQFLQSYGFSSLLKRLEKSQNHQAPEKKKEDHVDSGEQMSLV